MALVSDVQRALMLSNGERRTRDKAFDPLPVVKLHTLDAGAVWLLACLAEDGDRAYGLCDAGLGCPELGEHSLAALASMRGPRGMRVVADPDFIARQTLSAYLVAALTDGSLND